MILKNKEQPIEQNLPDVSYAFNIKRTDEIIDFKKETTQVVNQVRGLSDEVGATTFIDNQSFKVYLSKKSDIINLSAKPGEIISMNKNLVVKTLDGSISLEKVQLQGKKILPIIDFLHGQNILEIGKKFKNERIEENE